MIDLLDDGRAWIALAFATLGVSDVLHRRAAHEEIAAVAAWPRLFVYGTLRTTGPAHDQLHDALFLGPARLSGFRRKGATLVPDPNARTRGELYRVDPATWKTLDAWEGSDRWRRHSVWLDDGRPAFVYLEKTG